jgi:hypothetical protein
MRLLGSLCPLLLATKSSIVVVVRAQANTAYPKHPLMAPGRRPMTAAYVPAANTNGSLENVPGRVSLKLVSSHFCLPT